MIIKDFLDNDLYKFTTMNAIQKKFPDAEVVYRFADREGTNFPPGFSDALLEEVEAMRGLVLTASAEQYLRRKGYYFDSVFFDLLKGYRFDPSEVSVRQDGGQLEVEIRGLWYRTVLWEVPLMAIISELYFRMNKVRAEEVHGKTVAKARHFAEIGADISEFGTRRRFSFDVQDQVVALMKQYMGKYLKGSSNIYLAMKYDLTPMGTHPHEWFMYHGAHYGYRAANAMALANWVEVYHGNLGIALTDTYTTDNFFNSFDTLYAKLFDGLRWDSGDPFIFTEKVLKYYREKRIDPRSKTVVYSDALDLKRVQEIKSFINNRLHDVYGIGTYLTNDVGVKPLNIVIKMVECKPQGCRDFLPVVKLSDVAGKHSGDSEEIALCLALLKNRH